jgi:hypothetical protein
MARKIKFNNNINFGRWRLLTGTRTKKISQLPLV